MFIARNIEEITVFDSDFSIWDLGGQEAYRKEYLEDFGEYIKKTDKLIYAFDIQDTDRYNLALEYFEKVINLLNNNAS